MVSVADFVDKEKVAVLGIVIGIMLSLSPIPTFIDIAVHSKTTGGYTAAPYIASWLCCSMWLTYAMLAGSSKSDLIPLNALSFVIYIAYCGVFLYYADNRFGVLRLYMVAVALLSLTVGAAVFIKSLLLVGILATVANCLMFAAPLAVMKQVIKTKSVRYMPFLLSLTSFLCACVWLLWASLAKDYFVLIPNALGAFFGVIQLVLYGVYWRLSRSASSESIVLPGRAEATSVEELTPMKKATDFDETISGISSAATMGDHTKPVLRIPVPGK